MLVEAAGLAFVSAGVAIGMLPDRLRSEVQLPAAVFVLIGAVIWVQVLKAAARSRNELSSSLRSQDHAKRELAWSEERLHFAQEIARMGTWDTDLATGEGIWSESLRNTWGIEADVQPTYENFIALVHPDDRRRVQEIVVPAERDGGDFEYEYRICRPSGEIRWFLCRGRIVLGRQGSPTRSLGVAMDITHRKRADEDRTKLEQQLRQAQKLQAIGRLAGSVAHDFNNLLLAIRGYGELAQNAITRGEQPAGEIEEIVAVADRAADLTGQLLAFSRKQLLRPEVVDLKGVVGEMTKLLQLLVGESVELDIGDGKQGVHVNADRGQLEQVIANLAVNARDAMPAGGRLSIEVGTADLGLEQGLDEESRPCAVLVVSDTGCGMDAETSAQIFEPFFTTKEEGTGLGLATVHGIVTQTGGSIWVYSELGHGTTFKIYLPLVHAARAEAVEPTAPAENSAGETILLVEDDAQVRGIVATMLETRGYRVLAAGDAAAAEDLAGTSANIDLILSDLAVGGSNGRDIAERARELHPGARILHMSGYTDDAVLSRGVLEPGAAFIEKPFSSEELARRIRDVLDGRTAERSAA